MSMFGNIFAFARIAASTISGKAKAVLYNVERRASADERDTERAAEEPAFGPLGFFARPEPPSSEGECEALCVRTMDGMRPVVLRDLRISRRVAPAVGSLGVAHYGGGYVSLAWDGGRARTVATISTPVLDGDGNATEAHYLVLDASAGSDSVFLIHRAGQGLTLTTDGTAMLSSPNGKASIAVTDDGTTGTVTISGALTFAGGVQAGDAGTAEPVALAAAYEAILGDLLDLLATAFATNAIPGAPLAAAWALTSVPILQARLAALSTAGRATTLKASPL